LKQFHKGMRIPESHPRYKSLVTREKLVKGLERGLVALEGLMAHGRGEAFDYLIGEETRPFALEAVRAGVARLLTAEKPVLSVNGNVAALVPGELVELADVLDAKLEANIFYRSEDRVERIVRALQDEGATGVLGADPDARIDGLEGPRGLCSKEGIFCADVVFVPLEDGDRTEALKGAGKDIVTVDLNPLSRTAVAADVSIIDNVVRAVPAMISVAKEMRGESREKLEEIITSYDNRKTMSDALVFMARRLEEIVKREG
jgi:4-phosphopantoate--beta-alanine ligase